PHAVVYPEAPSAQLPAATGNTESGTLACPSPATPCTLTVTVKTADVGGVTPSSLLEQVGSYSFAAARPQSATTNPPAEADLLPHHPSQRSDRHGPRGALRGGAGGDRPGPARRWRGPPPPPPPPACGQRVMGPRRLLTFSCNPHQHCNDGEVRRVRPPERQHR